MKQIILNLNDTMEKLEEISKDHMEYIGLDFVDYSIDQNEIFPPFVNFYGVQQDGHYKDYSSLDALTLQKSV